MEIVKTKCKYKLNVADSNNILVIMKVNCNTNISSNPNSGNICTGIGTHDWSYDISTNKCVASGNIAGNFNLNNATKSINW